MKTKWKVWLRVITAGCVGGIALNAVTLILGTLQVGPTLGIDFAPDVQIEDLYLDLFWGAVWGLLFLIPFLDKALVIKGLVLSLVPSLVDLVIIFPYFEGVGLWGLKLGNLTPLIVIVLNGCWGLFAGLFLRTFR